MQSLQRLALSLRSLTLYDLLLLSNVCLRRGYEGLLAKRSLDSAVLSLYAPLNLLEQCVLSLLINQIVNSNGLGIRNEEQ